MKRSIPCESIQDVREKDKVIIYSYCLLVVCNQRTFVLRLASKEEMMEWKQNIEYVIKLKSKKANNSERLSWGLEAQEER